MDGSRDDLDTVGSTTGSSSHPEEHIECLLQRTTIKPNLFSVKRNAMGEFVPMEGGKPLTQYAISLPGPADYSPKVSLVKPSPPQYSIVGKTKHPPNDNVPGPNQYRTEGDMVWRDRGFPLIGKGKPDRHGTCSLGPAAYLLTHGNLGGKSASGISGRQRILRGPPDKRVQPTDSHGFSTPGPAEYRPSSSHWRKNIKKSFGLALKKDVEIDTPGPAEYDIKYNERGPAYSLGKRLPGVSASDNPGPAAYNIGTTIGESVAKSMSSRQPELSNAWAPSPNTYSIPSTIGESPKYSMTYRTFERKVSPAPSPASYGGINISGPKFTCRKVCRPIYPDILNYAEHSLMKNSIIGPGTYGNLVKMSKNDAPAHSMGKRFKTKIDETPGPASYHSKRAHRPDAKRAAAFSMGVRIQAKSGTEGPGPAAYYPKSKTSAPQHSMSGRNQKDKFSTTPAPNSYSIRTGQTNRGIAKGPFPTLKGRPSPYVYSGLKQITA